MKCVTLRRRRRGLGGAAVGRFPPAGHPRLDDAGLDGVEVCRKVRQESEAPYVYIILLTGKAERRTSSRAWSPGPMTM